MAEDACSFRLVVRTMHDEIELPDLLPGLTVSELCARAAGKVGWQSFQSLICFGESAFQPDSVITLKDAGLSEGDEVMLVQRPAFKTMEPGESRYNRSYYCIIHQAEEVGVGVVEIDFTLHGDMSAGKLQDPSRSRLIFGEDLARYRPRTWAAGSHKLGVNPTSHVYRHEDWEARIEGTLTFTGIPMGVELGFEFGMAGYSLLRLQMQTHDEQNPEEGDAK
eukprot:TRINITY_DN63888_c0_g1_i1.p1 TRINITY_DN63888_c0_g1~~TRINITY_DN63888_c0_g1_i1.p1  ORF type:complete len:246 (-),score=39.27 TRINITY_DN63888_c0_g1_i1:205-867(-)